MCLWNFSSFFFKKKINPCRFWPPLIPENQINKVVIVYRNNYYWPKKIKIIHATTINSNRIQILRIERKKWTWTITSRKTSESTKEKLNRKISPNTYFVTFLQIRRTNLKNKLEENWNTHSNTKTKQLFYTQAQYSNCIFLPWIM